LIERVPPGLLDVRVAQAGGEPGESLPVDPGAIDEVLLRLVVVDVAGPGGVVLAVGHVGDGVEEGCDLIQELSVESPGLDRTEVLALLACLPEVLEHTDGDHGSRQAGARLYTRGG